VFPLAILITASLRAAGGAPYEEAEYLRGLEARRALAARRGLDVDEAEEAHGRVERLIPLLVSKNRRPPEGYNKPSPPAGYKEEDQVVVFLTIQQLLQEGDAALDVLAEHLDDKPYSVSMGLMGRGVSHYSVGEVCRAIMRIEVECYEERGMLEQITWDQHLILSRDPPEAIWRRERESPLWRTQIGVIDRAIDFFKTVDLGKARPVHPLAPRQATGAHEAARARNIAKLEALKAVITQTRRPYRPRLIDGVWYGTPTYLPWLDSSSDR
jgi:hypothetical protein